MKQKTVGRLTYHYSPVLLKSGLNHGFFERGGGVSPEPYTSLNLKYDIGDDNENVEANYHAVLHCLGLEDDEHSCLMVANKDQVVCEPQAGVVTGYDAVIITDGSASITAADCASIIIFDPQQRVAALIHAGWYGTTRHVVERAIQEMIDKYQTQPDACIAVIGPTIAIDNYEIQSDVEQEVKNHLPRDAEYILKYEDDKIYLDIKKALVYQLERMGLAQIETSDIDTFTDEKFYSYRRDGKPTGRHGIFIGL